MSDLINLLATDEKEEDIVSQVAREAGASEEETRSVLTSALPALLGLGGGSSNSGSGFLR